jgi:hypothetical protein
MMKIVPQKKKRVLILTALLQNKEGYQWLR